MHIRTYKKKLHEKFKGNIELLTKKSKVAGEATFKCNLHNIEFEREMKYVLTVKYSCCKECQKHTNYLIAQEKNKFDYEYKEQLEQVHKDKNYTFVFKNKKIATRDKLEVICPITEHGSFNTMLRNLLNGHGCSICGNTKAGQVRQAKKDETYFWNKIDEIDLKNEIDYSKVIFKSMSDKITLICKKCNYEWETTPTIHICYKYKCNACRYINCDTVFVEQGFVDRCKNNIGTLYIIRCFNENEEFYKIGITSMTVKQRFRAKQLLPYNYEIIYQLHVNPKIVFNKEKTIKNYILKHNMQYKPSISFGGETECFDKNYINDILQQL